MNLLPQPSGNRPRLACEISPQGVVAARRDDAAGAVVAAAARVALADGAVTPGLRPGNIADRVAVTAALRKTFDDLGLKPNARGSDVTVVVPDAAVRVLLLDFDSLPNKLSEALPIVRFRLKKMLPFDADEAMVSYQVMSTSKQVVRVLAVAIPRDVLAEYETAVREVGFEPGAVLPSTLACCAGMDDNDGAAAATLLVNANPLGVTTAIVRSGILMLHRSVDLQAHAAATPANLPPALFEAGDANLLPLVDVDATQEEWAMQEALPEHGRNPYADRAADEAAVQNEDGVTGLPARTFAMREPASSPGRQHEPVEEPAPVSRSPYAAATVDDDLRSELHMAVAIAPGTMREFAEEAVHDRRYATVAEEAAFDLEAHRQPSARVLPPQSDLEREIAEAVNVAAAYFEDTLSQAASRILCAGPVGAAKLQAMLAHQGVAQTDGLVVRELVSAEAMSTGAVSASVPRGWLAGVMGALKS